MHRDCDEFFEPRRGGSKGVLRIVMLYNTDQGVRHYEPLIVGSGEDGDGQ